MSMLREVHVPARPLERFVDLLGAPAIARAHQLADEARRRLGGHAVWNVNSTAAGGGVAELLRALLPYARGVGIDARWVVIGGSPAFFTLTKRLHYALHGDLGDGSSLESAQHPLYEENLRENATDLVSLVRRDDVVILHDPQTAGLVPALARTGAKVVWRCHIGTDVVNEQTRLGWDFLVRYLRDAEMFVFTRREYVPSFVGENRVTIIPPSIDPFSTKNEWLDEKTVRAILSHVGLIQGAEPDVPPSFVREDGSPGRVDHAADIVRLGPAPSFEAPLVVQISRWDPLKDPIGVLHGFERSICDGRCPGAELVLAGPNVNAVADDPDGARVWNDVAAAWRSLPHAVRRRVHIACLPMHDVEENGAIVNALQRHAAVVVQKSLREGFGLTVTEAMWKARPVIASAIGGIRDQIEDGVSGILIRDPTDLDGFAEALRRILGNEPAAHALGTAAQARVREYYLPLRQLEQYAALVTGLYGEASRSAQGTASAA